MDSTKLFKELSVVAKKRVEYTIKEKEIMDTIYHEFMNKDSDFDEGVARVLATMIESYGLLRFLGVSEPWIEDFVNTIKFISAHQGAGNENGSIVFKNTFYMELVEPTLVVIRDGHKVLPPGKYLLMYDYRVKGYFSTVVKAKLFLVSTRVKNPEEHYLRKAGISKKTLNYLIEIVRKAYYNDRGKIRPFIPVSSVKNFMRIRKYYSEDGVIVEFFDDEEEVPEIHDEE